ncbi:7-carboxy-7-deazaguanine synthase QueE [Bacillus solimangrovi]|uniref:7-carboxy-7-deazaguanine synthase n=2 Tax=Bacillus solimangrovi TaxID=1305675 RepID=A0A1E5LFM5_9BACI|nr:7-carboxy-7-deazaguanine synthase QueE [Bacillus solimangrovi]
MSAGRKTMFVRTAGCDYHCSWCDSAFTWDGSAKEDIRQMNASDIVSELKQIGRDQFDHVTISGGNPALLKEIQLLIDILKEEGFNTALETQGSKWQDWFVKIDDLTLSPKPPSSEMKTDFLMLDQIIDNLEKDNRINEHVSLKVVVFNDDDFEYAKDIHLRYPNVPFYLQVGNDNLISESNNELALHLIKSYEWLVNKVIDCKEMNDVRVLPQLHALLWGNKRGV